MTKAELIEALKAECAAANNGAENALHPHRSRYYSGRADGIKWAIDKLEELTTPSRDEVLEEVARHCEETELLMHLPAPGTTLKEHGANVCQAIANEIRAMKGPK